MGYAKMERQNGQWVAVQDGTVLYGPDPSHAAVVAQFRAERGEDVVLLSDYSGMD